MQEFESVAIERNGDFNVEILDAGDGKAGSLKEFKQLLPYLNAMPFAGEKRLVVLKNTLCNGSAELGADLCEYLKKFDRSDLNVILYEEGDNVDKRRKLFKWLEKDAEVKRFEFPVLEGVKLSDFAREAVLKMGGVIAPDALRELCDAVKGDLRRLEGEVCKLCMYALGREIAVDDVRLLVQRNVASDVFVMIDALGKRNFTQARREFGRLLDAGESEYYLLSMVIYQFRNLIMVKYLTEKGMNGGEIAKVAKMHPFVVRKTQGACSGFSFDVLKGSYSKLLAMDEGSKTVSGFDLVREIDLFAYDLCR